MTVVQFILVGAAMFSMGLYGVITRKNAVLILASVELMLAAVNINMVTFDTYLQTASRRPDLLALHHRPCCRRGWYRHRDHPDDLPQPSVG